jgi:phosphodiesterase/alkaline phosphatase D-like protein
MPVTHWKIVQANPDITSIWVRSDVVSEPIDVTLDGGVGTQLAVCDGPDNTGVATFVGLTAEQVYNMTIESVTGTFPLEIGPANATAAIQKIALLHCIPHKRNLGISANVVRQHPDLVFFIGDTPYTHEVGTRWGASTTEAVSDHPAAGDTVPLASYLAHYETFHSVPGVKELHHKYPCYACFDDHEFPGGNWDHTITNAGGSGGFTQTECNNTYLNGLQAFRAYNEGIIWASSSNDLPSQASVGASPDVNDYDNCWYNFRRGSLVEVFVIDCVGGKDPVGASPSGKVMLGANQYAWLTAALLASTATWKHIIMSKPFYTTTKIEGSGNDSWGNYTEQQAALRTFINSNNIQGVVISTGDAHSAYYAAGVDFAEISGGTAGASAGFQSIASLRPETETIEHNQDLTQHVASFEIVEFTEDLCTRKVINQNDEVVFESTQVPGTNVFRKAKTNYPSPILYEHTLVGPAFSGYEDITLGNVWVDDEDEINLLRLLGVNAQIPAYSFPVDLPQGTVLSAAFLTVHKISAAGADLGMVAELPQNPRVRWGQDHLPTEVGAIGTPTAQVVVGVNPINFDVTTLVNECLASANWVGDGNDFINVYFYGVGPDANYELGAHGSGDENSVPRLVCLR